MVPMLKSISGTLFGDCLHSLLTIADGSKSLSFEDGFDLGNRRNYSQPRESDWATALDQT